MIAFDHGRDNVVPLSWMRVGVAVLVSLAASLMFEPALSILLPMSPAIPLAVVLVIAAGNGPLYGVASGITAGLLLDLLGTGAIGVNLGSMALVGFLAGKIDRILPRWPLMVRVAVCGPMMLAYLPMTYIFSKLAGNSFTFGFQQAGFFLAANILCAVLVTPFIKVKDLRF